MRIPRSGLAKSLITGAMIASLYLLSGTFLPKRRTRGTIVAAEAPPYSNADTKDGKTRSVANSEGNESTDSCRVLREE